LTALSKIIPHPIPHNSSFLQYYYASAIFAHVSNYFNTVSMNPSSMVKNLTEHIWKLKDINCLPIQVKAYVVNYPRRFMQHEFK